MNIPKLLKIAGNVDLFAFFSHSNSIRGTDIILHTEEKNFQGSRNVSSVLKLAQKFFVKISIDLNECFPRKEAKKRDIPFQGQLKSIHHLFLTSCHFLHRFARAFILGIS